MHGVALLSLLLTWSSPAATTPAPEIAPAWRGVSFLTTTTAPSRVAPDRPRVDLRPAAILQTSSPRPKAIQYSHAYEVRLRIHRDASFAMLPLFGAEAVVGQKLFTHPTSGLKGVHGVLSAGILGLFGVDTVTGVWNLKEGWKDPQGRTRRLLHGLLMLTADIGFVATDLTAPHFHDRTGLWTGSRSQHRSLAIGSISLATVGYLIMIFR